MAGQLGGEGEKEVMLMGRDAKLRVALSLQGNH